MADRRTPALTLCLGACVRVALDGERARRAEGVVIEVVPPGCPVFATRVVADLAVRPTRVQPTRYVVQCWSCRVLRRADEMVVTAP